MLIFGRWDRFSAKGLMETSVDRGTFTKGRILQIDRIKKVPGLTNVMRSNPLASKVQHHMFIIIDKLQNDKIEIEMRYLFNNPKTKHFIAVYSNMHYIMLSLAFHHTQFPAQLTKQSNLPEAYCSLYLLASELTHNQLSMKDYKKKQTVLRWW